MQLELYPISKEDRIMAILRGQPDPHGELWHQLLLSDEQARQKLSEELLEGLAPLLTAARMQLERNVDAPKGDTLQLLDHAIDKVRSLTRSLDPHTRNHFGFFEVMTSLVNRLRNEHSHIIWHMGVQPGYGHISEIVQTVAYRSLQLLLDNVLQHSQATEVWVTLSLENQPSPLLQLRVRDNGIGMQVCDLQNHDKACCPSLKEIASKAQLLGGKFVVDSEPGQGSSFVLALPSTRP
jgi:signal transduction histidine kinase